MIITICGSIKSMDKMKEAEKNLKNLGHEVLLPVKEEGNCSSDNKAGRVEAKKKFNFIGRHLDKIVKSDAILVVNVTKNDIKNYIGANTFLEIGFAYYQKKKIFFLNEIPDQPYIVDEIETVEPQVINGDYAKIF